MIRDGRPNKEIAALLDHTPGRRAAPRQPDAEAGRRLPARLLRLTIGHETAQESRRESSDSRSQPTSGRRLERSAAACQLNPAFTPAIFDHVVDVSQRVALPFGFAKDGRATTLRSSAKERAIGGAVASLCPAHERDGLARVRYGIESHRPEFTGHDCRWIARCGELRRGRSVPWRSPLPGSMSWGSGGRRPA